MEEKKITISQKIQHTIEELISIRNQEKEAESKIHELQRQREELIDFLLKHAEELERDAIEKNGGG